MIVVLIPGNDKESAIVRMVDNVGNPFSAETAAEYANVVGGTVSTVEELS